MSDWTREQAEAALHKAEGYMAVFEWANRHVPLLLAECRRLERDLGEALEQRDSINLQLGGAIDANDQWQDMAKDYLKRAKKAEAERDALADKLRLMSALHDSAEQDNLDGVEQARDIRRLDPEVIARETTK